MEARIGGKGHNDYGHVVSEMKSLRKKSAEWDLNDWKWDGHLFTASPLNSIPSDCKSRQLFPLEPEIRASANLSNSSTSGSDEINQGRRELEKRRRDLSADYEEINDEARSLGLNLGDQSDPVDGVEKTGKKTKVVGTNSSRAVCQVEDCNADLSNAKEYHRRHKVCDLHSKATKALVGNVMQRFCQQCSRFHVLQEFDEGKRSCRRRLAGHNRRRRKTHPDPAISEGSVNNERSSSYLLISLLRILSNMHSNSSGSDQAKDQSILSHLLSNLANLAGPINGSNVAALLETSQGLLNGGTSNNAAAKKLDESPHGSVPTKPSDSATKMGVNCTIPDPLNFEGQRALAPLHVTAETCVTSGAAEVGSKRSMSVLQSTNVPLPRDNLPLQSVAAPTTFGRTNVNSIDLNCVYDDTQDVVKSNASTALGIGSLRHPCWLQSDFQKSSPPQTSRNSGSTSTRSPSSSSGDAQCRTDRIVFKLFGKDPKDFPYTLRSQILNWLSNSPTDIESYIRPGCIILTVYIRLEKSAWEKLSSDLGWSLQKLLNASNDPFWRMGWMYARVQNYVAFVYNGQVVLDVPLPLRSSPCCKILSVKPIAFPASRSTQFVVKGYNFTRSSTRLLCAFEGNYLVQENCYDLADSADSAAEHNELQCLNFSCSIPEVTGRGCIEVEDLGLSSSFFPFIVTEQEICSEICMLEKIIEVPETLYDAQKESKEMNERTQALEFIHEMGWLLRRNHLKFKYTSLGSTQDLFPFSRLKWLLEFSLDHDWCAVVKKLLSFVFDGGVDSGDHPSIEIALFDMCLLHKAVKRNCRPMVELLLQFVPVRSSEQPHCDENGLVRFCGNKYIFKPDVAGPAGLTPLHIAASSIGSGNVLDALTSDPGSVGLEAWKNARDNTGLTPNDYASLRGHRQYIQLVQRKLSKKPETGHVVVDVSRNTVGFNIKQKSIDGYKSSKVACFETEKMETKAISRHCESCQQELAYPMTMRTSLLYRPVMLSMVAIAAVCVCVALLFKSSPKVLYKPFSWESLQYGSM